MTNNLRKVKKDLCSFAKKYKNFKYTDSALFAFLLTGLITVKNNSFAKTKDTSIKTQENKITTSIKEIKSKVSETRKENNKLIKNVNLELIQLMEQGDHVVKSPWSSWQYGANFFYNDWKGTYKGLGDKEEKYILNSKLNRGQWWERNVSPSSKMYDRVAISQDPLSTSTKSRKNAGEVYGLVGTVPIPDPGVPIIIQPRINVAIPNIPNLNINPRAINPNPNFTIPEIETVTFDPISVAAIRPNVFQPPRLTELSVGFSQDSVGPGFYGDPNAIVNQSNAVANASGTDITIDDRGFTVNGAFTYEGERGVINATQKLESRGTVNGRWENKDSRVASGAYPNGTNIFNNLQYLNDNGYGYGNRPGYKLDDTSGAGITAVSPQTVFNITQYQFKNPTNSSALNRAQQPLPTTITGTWTLRNNTQTPFGRTEGAANGWAGQAGTARKTANTVRFISLNPTGAGVGGSTAFGPVIVEFDGKLNLYGRNIRDVIGSSVNGVSHGKAGRPHLTIGMEVQTLAGQAAVLINKGELNLEKESAKNDGNASYLIGMTAMVEGYTEYAPTNNMIPGYGGPAPITYRPWASEMRNQGKINVKSVNSIGIDFAEFGFNKYADSQDFRVSSANHNEDANKYNVYKHKSYDEKGSLNMYVKTGKIDISSVDTNSDPTNVEGSYGIRIPNVFAKGISQAGTVAPADFVHGSGNLVPANHLGTSHYDEDGIYYDETIIDGKQGMVNVGGKHNVGVSISKNITGSGMYAIANPYQENTVTLPASSGFTSPIKYGTGHVSVYNYQKGIGYDGDGLEAKDAASAASIDNTGRYDAATSTTEDPIGNIYNLNITVDGIENVGLLRNSDYMAGEYSSTARSLAEKDFRITDGHIESIDFSNTADGGTLFRTDRYGINLIRNLTVNPGNASAAANRYNIVMLSNIATQSRNANAPAIFQINENDTILPKVKNTGNITVNGGKQNVIGLMAYQGAKAEIEGNLKIGDKASNSESKTSFGLVVSGKSAKYNAGNTAQTFWELDASGNDVTSQYVGSKTYSEATSKGNIDIYGEKSIGVYNNAGKYTMNGGTIKVEGKSAIGVYAIAERKKDGAIIKNAEVSLNKDAANLLNPGKVEVEGEGAVTLYAVDGADIGLTDMDLSITGNKALLFYSETKGKKADSFGNLVLDPITGLPTEDKSQLILRGNSTATINPGATAFYVKINGAGSSPLNDVVHSSSTGNITVNLKENSTLIVAEGKGGNTGGELLSNLTSTGSTHIIPVYTGVAGGSYIPYKATRLPLTIDQNVNLDNPIDAYLKSEFSSSSITVNAGKSITGSGAITSPIKLAKKSKVAIAQKNSTTGAPRNDVILTNNGTISLTGIGMAGIVGEYSEIYNNSVLNTIGDDSTGIITSNGGIATNNGSITVGNNGVGIAGINYLGVGDATYTAGQPTTGNGSIEIVHNGSINSIGTGVSSIGILAKDVDTSAAGNAVTAASPVSITLKNGSSIDMSAAPDSIGVYSDALYRGSVAKISDNGANITIGTDGVGLLAKGTEINATAGNIIAANNARAQGIFTDSDIVSFKNMTLLGDGSIGIHNYGVNTLYPTNQGRNYVNITNGGTITLGNSASINNPSIGMYTKYGNINHQGTINGGNNVIGILSDTPYAVNNNGTISFGDGAIGIYKKQGSTTLTSGSNITVGNGAIGVVSNNGSHIENNSSNINIGNSSFGFAVLGNGTNTYISNPGSNLNMGSNSVYLYKAGPGNASTYTTVRTAGNNNAALYATGTGAVINNYGVIDYSAGVGNVGAYAEAGASINNFGEITIGHSVIKQGEEAYSIGMATKGGTIRNVNKINVTGDYSIGMFAQGAGSRAINDGIIDISSSKNGYGMYIDGNGAEGINNNLIKTSGTGNTAIGIAVLNNGTFTNNGTVDINLANSTGIYLRNAIIKNYGTINISGAGSVGVRSKTGKYQDASGNITSVNSTNLGNAVNAAQGSYDLITESASDPSVTRGNSAIIANEDENGNIIRKAYVNGVEVPIHDLTALTPDVGNYAFSNVGIYVDTLGRTSPINWVDGYNPLVDNDLIIGTEVTELTTAKAIRVGSDIITPFLRSGYQIPTSLNIRSAALTWVATPTLDPYTDEPTAVTMTKLAYTDFVPKTENAWNFADGLEQRYGVEAVGTREKKLFDKLNSIGQNEQVLLTQAYDEMMGHQYGNTQQRINSTGSMLDKEFKHLKKDWRNPSKQNNKIKVFGMRDEYKSDTAGIIDYTSNSYGFAYVHEDERIKMGNSSGWYAGAVTNRFKFKDIGKSKENQTMLKAGVFKTMSPKKDYNGALQWTIGGDVFAGLNNMQRRYLVVDEIFQAKSSYHSYGAAVKTDLGYDIRMSERTHLRPYGALKMEYGRFNDIKEDNGEVRLEVKGNDYFSVRPEVGVEFRYVQPLAVRTNLSVGLTASYENELGKVGEVNNKGRVRYTTADWFNIRGEKDDRRGNGKFDLNIGVDNTRFGVTVNGGYDTKGNNVRGGIGFRAIY